MHYLFNNVRNPLGLGQSSRATSFMTKIQGKYLLHYVGYSKHLLKCVSCGYDLACGICKFM